MAREDEGCVARAVAGCNLMATKHHGGALERAADLMVMASGPASDGREAKADIATGANQARTLRGHRKHSVGKR